MLYDQFIRYDHALGNQLYACCPFHSEKTPSFTVNKDTHEWYCHGCGKGGAEREFVSLYFDVSMDVAKYAVEYWKNKLVWPFPTQTQVDSWSKELYDRPRELEVLYSFGFTDEMIKHFQLGWDDCRITFPVRSRTNAIVNVRRYLPPHRRIEGSNNAKCINIRYLGSNRYYPYEAFDDKSRPIVIVEGEKDCIAARSQGLNAVTGTGGSTIPVDEIALFKDLDVILMLDTDSVGKKNTEHYLRLLRPIARSLKVITLPAKDFSDYFQEYRNADIMKYVMTMDEHEKIKEDVQAQEVSLVRSEFAEQLNTWIRLNGMSVVGVEPRIYTVPTKLRVVCRNTKCSRPCPLALSSGDRNAQVVDVDPRQILQFVDASDNAQDLLLRKTYGCKSVVAEPMDYVNVQKIIFQEGASFIDGLDEATFESRYGLYMYTDYRLSATLKYNFEACRVTDPRSQQNFYVIKSAESLATIQPVVDDSALLKLRESSATCSSAAELIEKHYQEWKPALGIEGRPDLFGALILTYCSVTEIPWQNGLIKGWLDTMVIGDTRTGKSQMAQRFVKKIAMGSYINGENARRTGVIGGVQRFGDSWVVTWGAVPMNDRGLLIIDEASGLDIEDIKDLSSTRSSGAVTINKIVKGEARARTRLLWLSNPRSGKNLSEFYWRGYGAFQEFIPVAEDQARFDLVLTAARDDIDVLQGIDYDTPPNIQMWSQLFQVAWSLESDKIHFPADFKDTVKECAHNLNDDFGGGPLIVGVAVHEKLLRMACAFAVLCGDIQKGRLMVAKRHLQFADEFLRATLNKTTFGYGDYIREFKRAQNKRSENTSHIRALVVLYPALRVLLSSSGFKGFQFQEILGIDRDTSSKIMSDLITRGLLRPTTNATYVPDKLLMEIAKQMEV